MLPRSSHARNRAIIAGVFLLGSALFPAGAVAEEPVCALAVTVEGVPQGTALQDRLTQIARREGACSARSWALRVAPGPKGTYVVALWNGAELETRFATQTEVEPVASVLLRVALERQGGARDAAPVASSTTGTANTAEPPAPPAAPTPTSMGPSMASFSVSLEGGPVLSNAGIGAEGGLLGLVRGRHLGAGIFGRYGGQGAATQARTAFDVGGVGLFGTPLGPRAWLGGALEIGLSLQRADGEADGNRAEIAASGVTAGGGLVALFAATSHLQLGARVMARWSSPSAEARDVTSTTTKNNGNGNRNGNGNGNGNGANKSVTSTTTDLASQHAVDALGGGAVTLALSVGYAF